MYNKVIQLYIYMYLFFFKFFSQLDCYRILSKVSFPVLYIYSRSLLVIHFKYSSVYMSVSKSLAVPPSTLPPVTTSLFSESRFLFCKWFQLYHFFLDSTYKRYMTSLSLSELLHLVRQSPGPSMLLQMAFFHPF